MATTRQIISVGSAANDGTGDTLRSAGQKINSNFSQIYAKLGGDSDNFSSQISLADSAVEFKPGSNSIFLSAIPTVTANRDIQLPDVSGIITLNDATQTLTNKSITTTDLLFTNTDQTGDGTITNSTNPYIRVDGADPEITINNATGSEIGKVKIISFIGTGTCQVTATGGNFNLTTNQAKMLIWTGSAWNQLT